MKNYIENSHKIALEFLPQGHSNEITALSNLLRKFAKIHVKEALKQAKSRRFIKETDILEAYPESNII